MAKKITFRKGNLVKIDLDVFEEKQSLKNFLPAFQKELGDKPFVVQNVINIKCTCKHPNDHQPGCLIFSVSHPQWLFFETPTGEKKYSGIYFQRS